MGFFDGINEKSGSRGGNYFTPGLYLVEVKRCVKDKMYNGVDFTAIECTVIESSVEDKPQGSTVNYFLMYDKWPEANKGRLADFLRAAYVSYMHKNGAPSEEIPEDFLNLTLTEKMAEAAFGPSQELTGVRLKAEAYNKKTKDGGDFTRVTWEPVK